MCSRARISAQLINKHNTLNQYTHPEGRYHAIRVHHECLHKCKNVQSAVNGACGLLRYLQIVLSFFSSKAGNGHLP